MLDALAAFAYTGDMNASAQWLERSLAVASALRDRDLIAHGLVTGRAALRGRLDSKARFPGRSLVEVRWGGPAGGAAAAAPVVLHAHSYPEVCLGLDGHPLLELENRRYDLAPPALALLGSGQRHAEAFRRRDQPYALLWIGGGEPSVLVHVMEYRDTVWTPTRLYAGPCKEAHDLLRLVGATGADPDAGRADLPAIRHALLAALCRLFLEIRNDPQVKSRPQSEPALVRHRPVLDHVKSLIDQDHLQTLTLEHLSNLTGLSPNYLNTLFRRLTGKPIRTYQIDRRLEEARRLLLDNDLLIREVAEQMGYHDEFYFSRLFYRRFGQWPSDLRSS